MPGLFGGTDAGSSALARLQGEFEAAWDACDVVRVGQGLLGGHAFQSSAVVATKQVAFALDGEASLRRHYGTDPTPARPPEWFQFTAQGLQPTHDLAGNAAVYRAEDRTWHLACAWSGLFPVYYSVGEHGLLFSSLLRPLARAVDPGWDPLGMLQFLRTGYTLGSRTLHQDILRLLPGQVLTYEPITRRLTIRETSKLWTVPGSSGEVPTDESVGQRVWVELESAVRRAVPDPASHALMLSGGWDSRTLLAALVRAPGGEGLLAYSHGNPESREIVIARRLSTSVGVRHLVEPVDERAMEPDSIADCARRVENLIFPHWFRAGRTLAGSGATSVSAGILGEVVGGHYGATFVGGAGQRVMSLARGLLGFRPSAVPGPTDPCLRAYELLKVPDLRRHWYLNSGFWAMLPLPAERINADLRGALRRLNARGINSVHGLIEGYLTEHRGGRRIGAQLLSIRAHLDVAFPLADRRFLLLATRLPFHVKVHNRLNQAMLRNGPETFLKLPVAAALTPAGSPLWLQEASRGVRKLREGVRWKAHQLNRLAVSPPKLSWVDFGFAGSTALLLTLADDLRLEIWDRPSIHRRLLNLRRNPRDRSTHRVFDQFMKIYTLDRLLRP